MKSRDEERTTNMSSMIKRWWDEKRRWIFLYVWWRSCVCGCVYGSDGEE